MSFRTMGRTAIGAIFFHEGVVTRPSEGAAVRYDAKQRSERMTLMIRVLCVEDEPLMRAYLATRLAAEPDIRLVSAVPDTTRAMIYLHQGEIDVVLLDDHLPGRGGTELLQTMSPWRQWDIGMEERPAVLFCTGFADSTFLAKARGLGARGVVAKERVSSDLIPAIRAVAAGGFWFDPVPAPVG